MAFHGPSYGLDAELKRKSDSKYDHNLEQELRQWIEGVSGTRLGGDFADSLKNGQILCNMLNKIKPGSVKKVNTGSMPFHQMENIQNFLAGCRSLGVADCDLFAVVDLYEKKNMSQVQQGLLSLGRQTHKIPGFRGPYIGPKPSDRHDVEFSDDKLREYVPSKQTQGSFGGATAAGHVDTSRNIVRPGAQAQNKGKYT